MAEKKNWFKPRKKALYLILILVVLGVLALNPIAYSSLTEGGTSWISIIGIVGMSIAPFLALYDSL